MCAMGPYCLEEFADYIYLGNFTQSKYISTNASFKVGGICILRLWKVHSVPVS